MRCRMLGMRVKILQSQLEEAQKSKISLKK